jgi:molybdopterin molybdotransferase
MVRLSSDLKAYGEALISVEQATSRAATLVAPVTQTTVVALAEADGRVLARDVVAGLDLPPFANSAVDGYAVRFSDLAASGETRLALVGRAAAGSAAAGFAADGGAIRIFTGAPMPAGTDTVFMQEDVARDGDKVTLPSGLKRGANARPAGEDIAQGEVALPAGRRLQPQDIALLAALGTTEVEVRRPPVIALFSTGDELTEPGTPLGPAAIYDANRSLLRAMITRVGAQVLDLGILRDEPLELARSLTEAASRCDLILTSGGVSSGEEDHVKAAVARSGALDLWRVGIKPGRPVAIGQIAETPFIGLPGNPVAVFVTFAFIARPLIARLSGVDFQAPPTVPVRLAFPYEKKAGRREYLRVSLSPAADGLMLAHKHPQGGAGALASLSRTDGLVELAEALTEVEEGRVVPFHSYDALMA